jgi:MraZ protein
MSERADKDRTADKFSGRFINRVDGKGRVFFPAKMKANLNSLWGAKPDLMLTVLPFERCLVLVQRDAWFRNKMRIEGLDWLDPDAAMLRRLSSLAEECTMDANGRLALPQFLRDFAHLQDEVMFIGCEDYIELWNPKEAAASLDNLFKEAPDLIRRVREKLSRAGQATPGQKIGQGRDEGE